MSIKKIIIAMIFSAAVFGRAEAQFVAPDPSRNVPNARVLALGKAYTGLADDTAAIFTNPAGLAAAADWSITSMSGKMLDEFSYLSFSGLYPTELGVLGIGYVGTSISGAYSTTKDPNSSDQDPIYIIDTSQPPINYFNNISILSFGSRLSRFLNRFGWEDRLSLGVNLKLFSSGLAGDAITQGSAVGKDVDLGIMYAPPWPWLSLGATLQNLLPAGMGGTLRYESGHEESYPAMIELGTALNLIGKEKSLWKMGEHEVKLLLDYFSYPTIKTIPPSLHLGIEYRPLALIALRAGIDQDAVGDGLGTGVGLISNLTAGVGFELGGFRFDYAYQQFAAATGISNNYFSLSYRPVPAPRPATGPAIVGLPDKLITYESEVSVEGRVVDARIRFVTVDDRAAKMDLKGGFSSTKSLSVGKNSLLVRGLDRESKRLFSTQIRVLRLVEFADVGRDYWVAQPVSLLAMAKIITGYPDGTFRPEGNITRAEMCTLLMKTVTGERGVETAGFSDVVKNHWAAKFIAQAAGLGVVRGYPNGTFRPTGNITRAEGLAMIARFAAVSEEAAVGDFPDVAADYWAAKIIAGARSAGLLKYLEGKLFEPDRRLTRAEAVEMLQRTTPVRSLLDGDLLNWESY